MTGHQEIWTAVDRVAQAHGLTPSGLARKAGLDPTTFNKSKRATSGRRLRWPSTESIDKILEATGTSWGEFVSFMAGQAQARLSNVPVIGFAQAGTEGFFDDAGYPCGGAWDEISFPDIEDPHAYALEISGDSMEPVYRDGDIIVVYPKANIRRGDRVVVRTRGGEVMAKILRRQTAHKCELKSLNPEHPDRWLATEDIEWIARIVWASQ
jgi:phage repressor protein C with HTH and peptisase S24 domain